MKIFKWYVSFIKQDDLLTDLQMQICFVLPCWVVAGYYIGEVFK